MEITSPSASSKTPEQPAHDEQELLPAYASESAPKPVYTGPITAILQWLTYAFWGWVAVAVAALVAVSTGFALDGYSSDYESVAYMVASALVLAPIALVCDILFSKREEDHKHGIFMVIMVIHAVLYALLAVGALATMVFSLISIILSDTSNVTGPLVVAVTAAVLVVFYTLLFIRIIRPAVKTKFRLLARLLLLAIVLGAMIWGIAGPVVQSYIRKDDRRAAQAAQTLSNLIDSYATKEKELPKTIEEAAIRDNAGSYSQDSTELVRSAAADKLVTYTPNTKPATVTAEMVGAGTETTYFYELCVTYAYDDASREISYGSDMPSDNDGYQRGLFGTSGKAGTHCYDLKLTVSSEVDGVKAIGL